MPIGQRVVLIGGGHNALITAFYLAKGGFKPLVLERREMVGGGAITEEFHPGFRASTLAHTLGPLRANVARDLRAKRAESVRESRGFEAGIEFFRDSAAANHFAAFEDEGLEAALGKIKSGDESVVPAADEN